MHILAGPALLLVLVIVELGILKFVKKQSIPWSEVTMNLNSGHIVLWIFRGLQLIAYSYVQSHYSFNLIDNWPVAAQVILGLVAWDFLFYISHYFHHKWKLLWAVHEVHHQAENYNISLGFRNSWYSSLTSLPFFLPLAFLGLSVELFLLVSSIHYSVQFYNHTDLVRNSGILDKFMITPSSHKIHHGINSEYLDKNFGGTLNIWDKIFFTFQKKIDGVPIVLGTKEKFLTSNVFWINNFSLFKYFGLEVNLKSESPKHYYKFNEFIIFLGGILLFFLLLLYIHLEKDWSSKQRIVLILGIIIATISLGGLFESQKWALFLWVIFSLLLSWVFVVFFSIISFPAILLFGLISLHGLYMFIFSIKKMS